MDHHTRQDRQSTQYYGGKTLRPHVQNIPAGSCPGIPIAIIPAVLSLCIHKLPRFTSVRSIQDQIYRQQTPPVFWRRFLFTSFSFLLGAQKSVAVHNAGFALAVHHILRQHALRNVVIRRNLIHDIHQHILHNGAESSGTGLTLKGKTRDLQRRLILNTQLDLIKLK